MATKFLRHSDELYHYGVKGMKWHDHKYADEEDYNSTSKYENIKRVGKDIIDANFKPIKGKDVIAKGAIRGTVRKKARNAPTAESLERHVAPSVRRGEMRLRDSQRRSKAIEKEQNETKALAEQQKIRLRDDAVRKEALRRSKEEEHIREKERKASQDRYESLKRDERVKNEDIARKNYEANRRETNERHERVAKNVSDQRRRNYVGREDALREQERQARERRSELERQRDAKHARTTYADANDYAAYNARVQRHKEKAGRDAALMEQERQAKERQAIERRNRKRLSSAVSRNAQYYNKKR